MAIPGCWGHLATDLCYFVFRFFPGFLPRESQPHRHAICHRSDLSTPDGTSYGLIQLCGQASVVFVYVMEAMRTKDGSFTPSLLLATVLLVVCLFLIKQMKDIQYIPTEQ